MTNVAAIDLNGLVDRALVHFEQEERRVQTNGPSVAVVENLTDETGTRIIVGREALESLTGRGCIWPTEAEPNLRIPILHALDRITNGNRPFETPAGEVQPRDVLGELLTYLASGVKDAVIAIPDLVPYDETVQQRLLDASSHAGIHATLVWRPVSLILAWAEALQIDVRSEWDRRTVAVLSLMPDGVHLSSLALEKILGPDGVYLVPVRRHQGLKLENGLSIRRFAEAVAERFAENDPGLYWQALWGTSLAWDAVLGKTHGRDALQRADGNWTVIDQGLESDEAMRDTPTAEILTATEILTQANVVLIDGQSFGPELRIAQHVYDRLNLEHYRARSVRLEADAVLKGCIITADRMQRGLTTYFDFLPQLEINILSRGQHLFKELVPRDARAEGGKPFRRTIEDQFLVGRSATKMTFYLIKEGFDRPRRSVEPIPTPPTEDVNVQISVEQIPAQGYARIVVLPDKEGALGRRDLVLNWDRMEPEERSREKILAELQQSGFSIPDPAPQRCHPLLWISGRAGLTLPRKLDDYCRTPELSANTFDDYVAAAHFAAQHLAWRRSPYMLSGREDPDRTLKTAVSSDGELPFSVDSYEMPADAQRLLDAATKRALRDLDRLEAGEFDIPVPAQRRVRSALLRLMTWCFTACPDRIIDGYRRMVEADKVDNPMLSIRGMGRVFDTAEDLKRFFGLLESAAQHGRLKIYHRYALKEILLYRENSAALLTSRQATIFAKDVSNQIAEANQTDKFDQLFSNALTVVGALLRYRVVDPTFLTPVSSKLAQEVRDELDDAIENLRRPARNPRKRRRKQRMRELTREVKYFLDQSGTNLGVLVEIVTAEVGEEEDADHGE